MQADREPEAVVVGRVGRPHGVDGAFVVERASEDPKRFELGATLFVAGEPACVTVSRQVGRRSIAIKLDRPVKRGDELTIRREDLALLPDDSYYVADLVGLAVIDADGTRVGAVNDVLPGPANDVLELDTGVLLPLVEDCIREVDLAARTVRLNPGYTD